MEAHNPGEGADDVARHTGTDKNTKGKVELENQTFHDFMKKEPRDYGVENESDTEENIDDLGESKDLPDLYDYLKTLQKGNDLAVQREPQSLFNRPEHVGKYKNISALKYVVQEDPVAEYVEQFDQDIQDDMLMIADIGLDNIQDEEKRLRDDHITLQKSEQEKQKQIKQLINKKETDTKKRHGKDLKREKQRLARLIELAKNKEKLQNDLLLHAFWRAESQLKIALKSRVTEVKKMFGTLTGADGEYGGTKGRRWKLDWDKAPQPIQVKLKSLRGVRDKLPVGNYVVMCSLYNRLGGHVMRWSNIKGQYWGGATIPTLHEGHYYNQEIKLNQSLFTVLPSKPSVRPGMVLVFEVYLLGGTVLNNDRVVAWGCFPICDGTFEIIEGKYKAPMLRGEIDFTLDKHAQIEKTITNDLDHWLCNVYFEIVRLPRYMGGQKEYEVELAFSSLLVNHPDRINMDGEEYKDSENPILGSAVTITSKSSSPSLSDVTSLAPSSLTNKTSSMESLVKREDNSDTESVTEQIFNRRAGNKKSAMTNLNGDSDSEQEVADDDLFVLKKDDKFQPVENNIGLFSRKHLNNPVDVYTQKLYNTAFKGHVRQMKRRKLTYAEELEQYTTSVKPPFSEKGQLAAKGWKRISYVVRMFLAELGLSEWASREFWGMIFLFIITFFMRIFIHYTGQFLFLKGLNIPINSFNFLPYTVHLNYQPSLLHSIEEVVLVSLGPLSVFLFFVLGVVLSWLCQLVFKIFPDIGAKFILAFGIQSFFNPIFIMAVDLGQGNYDYLSSQYSTSLPLADFSKLYWSFYRTQGSGYGGLFATLFIYIFVCFASAAVLYMYFLRLHNNGRMLDIYWRLHNQEEEIFIPYDLEMSIQELDYITEHAEAWRGEDGARRKIAVYDYVWEEEAEFTVFDGTVDSNNTKSKKNKKEKTTHVAIHTIFSDGLRELYRHFLVLPDGAIVEVFGEMSYVPGLSKDIKKAVNQGARKLENLVSLGSTSTIGGLRRASSTDSVKTPLTGKNIRVNVTSGFASATTLDGDNKKSI